MSTNQEAEAVHRSLRADDSPAGNPQISIVVPVKDEEANAARLVAELRALMDQETSTYEVLIINDGSEDRTAQVLQEAIGDDHRFTVVELARCFGQSAAMSAGFNMARGDVIVPMDGDLQNDPQDIPKLVNALDEAPGYDIVSGWRKDRKDKWFSRRLPSLVANRLIRRLTYCEQLHDFGCTLKAYRREALADIHLYGEMHRFLPALCQWRGARLSEKVVHHRPRTAGESKYGLKRSFKVLFDLITVKFMGDYLTKPLYFFAQLSALTLFGGMSALGLAVLQKFGYLTEFGEPVRLNNNIFVFFALMLCMLAVVFVMMGVISELLVRIYHESQDRKPYRVRRIKRGNETLAVGLAASRLTVR